MNEIPHEALDLRYNSSGFLPDVGLHRRGDVFYHGLSRSHFWLLGVLLTGAVIVALLPWHARAVVGELKYWIAGMLMFGGLCDILGSLVQRTFRQQGAIDAKQKTVLIVGNGINWKLSWEQIIGLQICRQKAVGNSEMNGYQLNLVWREADGAVRRHCLLKHAVRGFVVRLGRRYESLFGFTVMDYTHGSQADGAANQRQPIRQKPTGTSTAAGSRRHFGRTKRPPSVN